MKTLFTNTIIQQAIELGFDFDQHTDNDSTVEEIINSLFEFFNEKSAELPQLEDECEVTGHSGSQNVSHDDYVCSGEIVDFSQNLHQSPDHKVFHSDYITEKDGKMVNMNLFYLVGETDCNAPEGYYYDTKRKCHVQNED